MQARLVSKTEKAKKVWEFCWETSEKLEYTPGQYAHFRLAALRHERPRAFSLISHPSENTVRFLTRLHPPLSPYKQVLSDMLTGDIAELDEPMGDCILPRTSDMPLVFVAQGLALASYLSIFTELARPDLARDPRAKQHELVLLWTKRSEDDPLQNLIPGEIPHFTRVDMQYPERLTAHHILKHVTKGSLVYLSGSQSFVEQLGDDLEKAGIPRARLIYEYYDGYPHL